jgi:hypothetical protein
MGKLDQFVGVFRDAVVNHNGYLLAVFQIGNPQLGAQGQVRMACAPGFRTRGILDSVSNLSLPKCKNCEKKQQYKYRDKLLHK